MRRRFSLEIEEPPINMTPLIDVVFVILIGFIVIAPMLDRDQVELASKPQELRNEQVSSSQSPIQLKVLADDSVWLKGQKIDIGQLRLALGRLKEGHPGANPVVVQDRRASFGTYQEVKNACEQAGFQRLDVILKPR
jgi:biopolymer transport protein ExbD